MYYKEQFDNLRSSIQYHYDYIEFIKDQYDNNDEMAQEIIIARLKLKLNKLRIKAIQEDFN